MRMRGKLGAMELAEEKEAEARRLRVRYVEQMQAQAAREWSQFRVWSDSCSAEAEAVVQRLQADFEYNLRLAEERDAELARYEAAVAELREAVNLLTAESSELKVEDVSMHSALANLHSLQVCLAEREEELARETEEHQQRLVNLQAEMEERRRSHRDEVEGERRKFEGVRRELEMRLREVEGERERVRLELTAQFEEETGRMEVQHRTQVTGFFLWRVS